MSDGELKWVTNHMGHTKDTHFVWYWKESSNIKPTKMARILTAIGEGKNITKKKIDDLMNSGDTVRNTLETEDAEKGMFSCTFFLSKFDLQGNVGTFRRFDFRDLCKPDVT